jgi:BirA family biotin operon repressor/biotin-[acetyl-CoA-carboxylase] ligase
MAPSTYLDADEIRNSSFVRDVEIYEELGSTNDRAAELSRSPETSLPALVATRRQTAGRGRGTNRWWAADGALTFSLLLDTSMHGVSTRDWPRLSLATAVAICDALTGELEAAGTGLAIKWPNDVMLDGAKVSGILVESPACAASRERLVVGIGINVNNSWRGAPRETGGRGIALCDVTQRQHDLNVVLIATLNAMQFRLQQLAQNDPKLPRAWQKRCWLTEQDVEVDSGGDWMQGVCTGIDHDGALLVQNLFGAKRFYSGSVKVL